MSTNQNFTKIKLAEPYSTGLQKVQYGKKNIQIERNEINQKHLAVVKRKVDVPTLEEI